MLEDAKIRTIGLGKSKETLTAAAARFWFIPKTPPRASKTARHHHRSKTQDNDFGAVL